MGPRREIVSIIQMYLLILPVDIFLFAIGGGVFRACSGVYTCKSKLIKRNLQKYRNKKTCRGGKLFLSLPRKTFCGILFRSAALSVVWRIDADNVIPNLY